MSTSADRNHGRNDESDWTTVETVVRGTIAAEVRSRPNYNAGHPPLYSIRIGRARIGPTADVWISPHMSIYDTENAQDLLDELADKYRGLRLSQTDRRIVEHRRGGRSEPSEEGEV